MKTKQTAAMKIAKARSDAKARTKPTPKPPKSRKAVKKAPRKTSILTDFEESVKHGLDVLRKTGKSLKKAVTPRKTTGRKKSHPPILLGSMGIDLPPLPKKTKAKRKKRA